MNAREASVESVRTTSTGWPDGVTNVAKSIVGDYNISTIVVNEEGVFCYGETMVFDNRTGNDIAEQRCDPDDLTLALQHQEWRDRMAGRRIDSSDYEREGRGEIEWNFAPPPTPPRLPSLSHSPSTDAAGGLDLAGAVRYTDDKRGGNSR